MLSLPASSVGRAGKLLRYIQTRKKLHKTRDMLDSGGSALLDQTDDRLDVLFLYYPTKARSCRHDSTLPLIIDAGL